MRRDLSGVEDLSHDALRIGERGDVEGSLSEDQSTIADPSALEK